MPSSQSDGPSFGTRAGSAPTQERPGQAQLDAIYDVKRVDPTWEATLRPSKIPVNCPPVGVDPGCGTHGVTTLSARQSTLGVKGFLPTEVGEVKTQFEFDLFGMGPEVGNHAFRVKQAWGSVGPFRLVTRTRLLWIPTYFQIRSISGGQAV
jgi:hypothetical protein